MNGQSQSPPGAALFGDTAAYPRPIEIVLVFGGIRNKVHVWQGRLDRWAKPKIVCGCGRPTVLAEHVCKACGARYENCAKVPLRGIEIDEMFVTFTKDEVRDTRGRFRREDMVVEALIPLAEATSRFVASGLQYILPPDDDEDFQRTYSALAAGLHARGMVALARLWIFKRNRRWGLSSDGSLITAQELHDRLPAGLVSAEAGPKEVRRVNAIMSKLSEAGHPLESDPDPLVELARERLKGELMTTEDPTDNEPPIPRSRRHR
jgi:hypothetical protein